ncbi:hypothetical protein SLS53_005424 [Cytospora paraplurivora]|uniref:Uncharacterized protein n=1 Tax=Cytospora paraplurivora TaxID=2898453 RepID=A0AAN9U591_9PEZI
MGGQDWNYFELAQWYPCSAFRPKVCKSKYEPPVTRSLCFFFYSHTDNAGKKTDTMIADLGSRALDDDPIFNSPFKWERQDCWMNPAPHKAAFLRHIDIASAAYQKRAAVEATLRNRRFVHNELLCTAYALYDADI